MRRVLLVISLALTCWGVFAQSSSPEGFYDRGMDAISGAGPSRNNLQAVDYFRRSAEGGYAPAQVVLGYFYDTGQRTAGSQSQALEWYHKAADQGDVLAQYLVGRRYYLGGGVQQDL